MQAERGTAIPIARRTLINRSFVGFCLVATNVAVLVLGILLVSVLLQGLPWLFEK